MQIDRFNISQHYDRISDNLKRADFVSFDCQFSGLVTNIQKIQGKFPDHREFYERIKQTALNFKILQIGLTAFIFNLKDKSYEPYSYNFYVLPYVNTPDFNNILISEVQSLAFLSQHGIDWNRIFKKGIIPQRLLNQFQYKRHQYDTFSGSAQKDYFHSQIDKKLIIAIEQKLQKISQKRIQQIIDFNKQSIYNVFLQKYMNKLILKKNKKTKQRFQFIVSVAGSLNKQSDDQIVFQKQKKPVKYVEKKISEQKIQENVQLKQLNNQTENISKNSNKHTVQNLLKIIVQRQIPIIGHFPNLDIGLIYHTYFQALPEKYEDFCDKISQLFPSIYDTKILSRRVAGDFKGMKINLKSLYQACNNKKFFQPYCNVIQSKLCKQNQNRHEAGYDSYLTGFAFVGMANYITKNDKSQQIHFKQLQQVNNLIYSRDTGQISLRYPYCSNSIQFQRKIIILKGQKKNNQWKQIAQLLTNYGTLYVTEDHEETYLVFEEQTDKIEQILQKFQQKYSLRHYNQRKIAKARDTYARAQKQTYYNE